MTDPKPVLQIEGLSIEAIKPPKDKEFRGEKLLIDIQAEAHSGEILLLLGPSGSGKSLLTNLLLGLISPHETGLMIHRNSSQSHFSLSLNDQKTDILSPVYPSILEGELGIMFQSLGLFDDLTVSENLAFANDQSRSSRKGNEWKAWQKEIIKTLGLTENVLHSNLKKLSGGQKQRVALGRLLAFRPQIMIFDEPTSALDPISAKQAVSLIQETHRENNAQLSIIITHDYENFLPIADRVWFINPEQRLEDNSPPQSNEYYQNKLMEPRNLGTREIPAEELMDHEVKVQDIWWNTGFARLGKIIRKVTRGQSYFWFLKYFWVMIKLIILRAIPYHLTTGLFLGFVTTYFSLHLDLGTLEVSESSVPIENFIVPTFFKEMLSGFGIALFRVLIPLFTCIFIAARSGTAITAYLSNMRDSERRQWDAMHTFGVEPHLFFFPQVFICFVLGCWVLSYLSFLMAALGSLFVTLYTNPLCTWYTWRDTFWANLDPVWWGGILPIFDHFGMFTLKCMCAGGAIATVSYFWGIKPRKTSMDTLRHLIGSNICNMMAILIIFFLLLLIE